MATITAGKNPAIKANQAAVLISAPLMFCPLPMFCIRFCRKVCNVGVAAGAADEVCACEALIEFIKFWKLVFKLASGSVEPVVPAVALPVDVLLADNCCSR